MPMVPVLWLAVVSASTALCAVLHTAAVGLPQTDRQPTAAAALLDQMDIDFVYIW